MNAMSEKELLEFRQSAHWSLRALMEQNQKEFQLGSYPQFAWDAWRGELVFASGGVCGFTRKSRSARWV